MELNLAAVISSRTLLFLSSGLFYLGMFSFAGKILRGARLSFRYVPWLFALLNAGTLLYYAHSINTPASMLTMSLIPLLVVVELVAVTKDKMLPYLHIYFSGVLNLLCSYTFAAAIVRIWGVVVWEMGSMEERYAIFSLSMLLGVLTYIGLQLSRLLPISVMAELMHSRTRSMLLFVYFIVSDLVLLCSAQSIQHVAMYQDVPPVVEVALHLDRMLTHALIWGCSFLIIRVQVWQEHHLLQGKDLSLKLQTERDFRTNRDSSALMSYCANLSRNTVLDGREVFPELEEDGGGYVKAIRKFAVDCIHPEDLTSFQIGDNIAYYEMKLQSDPHYAIRFRISPKRLVETVSTWHFWGERVYVEKEWIWVEFKITLVRDSASGDILLYAALASVDEEVEAQESLRQAATTDPLTGLLNRAALNRGMEEKLSSEMPGGTLFIIDMDYFKQVNDSLGHPAGDALLKQIAEMLRGVFRGSDFVSRVGGDEFCVFAPGLVKEEAIVRLARAMNQKGRIRHEREGGEGFQTSLSIGVARCPEHGSTVEELYRAADCALYQAKQAGRDGYRIYSPEMQN